MVETKENTKFEDLYEVYLLFFDETIGKVPILTFPDESKYFVSKEAAKGLTVNRIIGSEDIKSIQLEEGMTADIQGLELTGPLTVTPMENYYQIDIKAVVGDQEIPNQIKYGDFVFKQPAPVDKVSKQIDVAYKKSCMEAILKNFEAFRNCGSLTMKIDITGMPKDDVSSIIKILHSHGCEIDIALGRFTDKMTIKL